MIWAPHFYNAVEGGAVVSKSQEPKTMHALKIQFVRYESILVAMKYGNNGSDNMVPSNCRTCMTCATDSGPLSMENLVVASTCLYNLFL
jgi:hypothetical protein